MTLSSPRRLNTVGKRLLTIFSVVVFTCVLITLVLQPADTSAQKSEATLTPAATLSDNADTQSKKNATATPASTQQATATPVSTWLPTPTPAGRQTPTPQTESARPPIIRAVESDPDPRGYSDLAATFYTDKYLSQFLLSQAHEAPIDFHLTCVDESPYEGCKLLSEQPYGVGYSVRWQGVLVVPDDGEYTFTLADVDDGARLFLDGTLVTDWSWNWPSSDTLSTPRSVTLSAGEHSIIVDYMQRPPLVASLEVRWSGPTFAEEIIPVADIERIKDRDEDECPLCSDEVQGSVGDPINTYYGNFIYRATDLSLPTVGQSLRIERTYNTLFVTGTKIYTQPLGYGWIHNYNVHLTFPNDPGGEENTVILNARHGSRLRFTIEGSEYIPDPGIQATLISTLDDPKVYTVTAVHQETYVFTATGQLIGYYDTKGNQTAYTYQDEQLSRITDVGSERWLDLGYDDQARLTSVTDPISRSVQYDYDLNGDLSVVTDTRGLAWTYIYTGSHLLSTIIDPDGRTVERTFYDTQARAVRQEDGLGNAIVQLNYAPGGGQRVITEAGKVTTDTYDVEAVLVGRIDAQGHAQDYGFNDNLFRESVSDANGNTTRYARTSLGLTTAITDAQGQVTTMAYDELNNLTEMTDARGVTTSFTYSGTFLTRKTDALGNTWLYTPTTDGRNLLATEEASGGRVTHYEYDAYGQRITVTDTLQNVTRSAYDPIGRLITTTDAAGLLTVNTYDNADHLVAVTRNYTTTSAEQNYLDAYNLITRYQYDGFGRQIAVTDTVGHVMCNFYDGAGRLVSTTVNYSPTVGPNDQNLYNFTTFYGYDTAGRQILVTDTLGTATRTEYDNLSRPITVTQNYQNGIFDPLHPDEDLASVTHYDAVGNPIEQIDPAGRLTRTYYDSLNRVISTTANYTTTTSEPGYLNLYNLTTWNEYDEVGRQVAITDTQGRVTHNYYDALGRAISTTQNYRPDVEPNYLGQYNLTTLNEYNLLGQRVAMTDALSQPTRYTYDVMGRVVQTENALGGTTETGYDSLGRRSVVTDALQHTTIYTYDAIGRLSQTQDAGGNVTTYGYDVLGRTIVVTDPLDHATRTFYDFAGRAVSTTNALSGTTTTLYDALGRALRTQDARGNWTDYQYDRLGRTVVMTDATGAVLRTEYDRAGNRIKSTDGLSHTLVYTYDLAGRLIAQADPLGNLTQYTYDAAGNRTQTIDANGVATGYGYDSLNRLSVVTESVTSTLDLDPVQYNVVTRYAYDALGNRTVLTNARGISAGAPTTTYEYDALSRLTGQIDALNHRTQYAYDALGNRTVMTDANGEVTLYAYDALNRPSLTTYVADDQTVQYAYDAVGNRTAMTDSVGTTHYEYDELQRLIGVTDPFTGTVQYGYDANNNRTQLIYPDGQVVTYTYDVGNRLSGVLDWTEQTTAYQYDQAGRLSAVELPNGIKTVYVYDAANRLIRLTHMRNSIEMIGDYQFVLDGVGNRLTVTETLLPAGTGGQVGALPPTFAAEVIAAVTGQRAPGLSAPLALAINGTRIHSPTGGLRTAQPPRGTDDTEKADEALLPSRHARVLSSGLQFTSGDVAGFPLEARGAKRDGLLAPLAQGGSGLDRREENDASITYGPSAWTRTPNSRMSRGYYNGTNTAGRTASLTFTGSWVGLGFLTSYLGGQAQVYIDGQSQGIVDTYSPDENVGSIYYRDLVSSTHTISLTVLSTKHPNSNGTNFRLDYFDLWAGAPATGRFEENNSRVITSTNWTRDGGYAGASGGCYYRDGSNVWFGFEGDTVTYQAVARTNDGEVAVLVDGETRAFLTLKNSATITRVLSLNNLGEGPHVLQINAYRDTATVDAFITPGSEPYYQPLTRTGVIRYEEDDPIIRYGTGWSYLQRPYGTPTTGWTSQKNAALASDGYYVQGVAGQTVTLVFTGTWVGFGYIAMADSGQVSVTLDGASLGVVDTYARLNAQQSVYYRDLASGSHTLTLKVLNTKHFYSGGTYFRLDYFDVWDGTDIATGIFETPFATTWTWANNISGVASGGRYYSAGGSNAMWQTFTGDSITYQGLATTNQGEVEVQIDGQVRGYINLKNSSIVTRPVSFGGLGAGPHVLQVRAYRDTATVDAFITPGSAPYYEPPARSGVIRYEEDDPAIRYGLNTPYLQRPSGWTEAAQATLASDGYYVQATSAGQTVTLVFTGTWVGFGYIAMADSGQVSVTLDGASLGVVDTYARLNTQQSVYYRDLTSSTHTLTLQVLNTKHLYSNGTKFNLDYFDVWDGTDIATGTFETPFATTWNWNDLASGVASGGRYYSAVYVNNAMWQAFTGDSITYQGLATTNQGEAEVQIDGQVRGYINLKNSSIVTRPVSFGGLGAGPHVLQVRAYRDTATVDAFITPGSAPYYEPPARSGVIRYEEDDPAIRYGLNTPYLQRPSGWTEAAQATLASDGYYVQAISPGQTVTLVFTGTWVGFGYIAMADSGQVSVTLDGASLGVVDTYARLNTQQSVYYRDLTSSTHTLTLQVLNTKHLYSNGTKFNLDYFDVWDGTDITTGTFETPFATTWNWNDLASGAASGGRYYSAVYVNNAMWQAFTGDSINYQGLATTNQGEVEIQIDGQVRGYINLKDSSSITRPVSFGNLGAGPHVLQVRAYRNTPTVDAFITPGSAPYYEPPTRSGVIRYEEDDPAIRYGLNAPYLQMPQVWEAINDGALASDGYYVRTNSVGQTVTLPFTGTWVGFGYIATSNSGQITLTLDGVQLGVLDAYAPTTMQRGWYTAGLSSGVHTLTLKLSPIRNAGSSGTYFNFDYFDQWDGSLLPAGRFETPFATTWNWTEYTSGIASGGSYYSAGSSNAMWHAFTSDAVTYQALTVNGAVTAEVSIDGITRGLVSLYHPTVITRTFDYSGLGVGPHVLQVRAANGAATVDAFITPSFYPTATQRTVITYAYDPLYRLTQANATGALTYTFAYDYDAVGNRTAQTQTITSTQVTAYQYDAANRLASVDGQAYTWDDNGNLVNDGEKTYTYNQANRLTDLTQGETTYQFNYNGDGVRLRQMIAGVPTTYTQDLATPLPVVLQSQAGESTMQYVYALGTRPLAQYGSAWEYLLADALGSVRQIVDEDGDVTLAESYEPYGSVLSSTGAASSIFGYSGEETDTSGLVYLRARYMNPMLGIFLARDPWSGDQMRPGSMNGYSYAYANPIKYTDPSGWITEDEATRPGGADEIVEGLLQTYHVRIVKDWGFVPVRDQPGLGPGVPILPTCSLWTEGNWRKIDELEWIAESVHIVATGLGGNEKIQSALGSELKLIRLKHSGSFAPPGILSWVFGGDIVLGDDIGGDEIFTKGTIPHEFAHVWDYRTQNQLSKGLMEALGTWVCSGTQCAWNPFAKHFDPVTNSYVYPERAPGSNPRCLKAGPPDPSVPDCQETSYANTYGDAPVFTGPGWEDWATSFEAFVYPERLLNYRLQTALVNGGVREAYVRGKINDIP